MQIKGKLAWNGNAYFLRKNKKSAINLLSAEFALKVAKVKFVTQLISSYTY